MFNAFLDEPETEMAMIAGTTVFATDAALCKCRHLIETVFMKLKRPNRIAMGAIGTATSFTAMVYAATTIINSG